MKFLRIIERTGSYISFELSEHAPSLVNLGDQIWSDGREVAIYDCIDESDLTDLLEQVENKTAFKGALRRMEVLK